MKRSFSIFILSLVALNTLPAFAGSWITWKPFGKGFTIQLPAAPRNAPASSTQWQALDDQKRLYMVEIQRATPGLDPTQEQLEALMEDLAVNANGSVKDKRFFKYKDLQACEFRVATLSGQLSVTRIVVTPNRRYVLNLVGFARNFDEGMKAKFFDSLQFMEPTPTPTK